MEEEVHPEQLLDDEKLLGQLGLSESQLNLIKEDPEILKSFVQK